MWKQLGIALGVAAVGVGGYFVYESMAKASAVVDRIQEKRNQAKQEGTPYWTRYWFKEDYKGDLSGYISGPMFDKPKKAERWIRKEVKGYAEQGTPIIGEVYDFELEKPYYRAS